MKSVWSTIGVVAGIVMPLWNIPLILRIVERKRSDDISLAWLFGVWACILLMLPSTLLSSELGFKAYGISNAIFFSMVVVTVVTYRKNGKNEKKEGASS